MTALPRIAGSRRQRGVAAVEFAIVGLVFFIIMFGVIEIGRMMFARTLLEEGVRRGARLAVVCPLNDPAILSAAVYGDGGGSSRLLNGLTTANMRVDYLNGAGAVVANPAGNYLQIRFVRVSVQNFTMPLAIPGLNLIFQPARVDSTLPAESLGVSPTAVTAC